MPRRGLFRRANDFGVFNEVDNRLPHGQPEPALSPAGEPQQSTEMPPNSDNLVEILATLMPGGFPQSQDGGEQQAAADVPETNPPVLEAVPLVRRQGRFRRLLNHISNHNMVPADFQAPTGVPPMSWTEVRAKIGDPPPAPNKVDELLGWDRIRHRIGLNPTYEYIAAAYQQGQPVRLQNHTQMQQQPQLPGQAQPQAFQGTLPPQIQGTAQPLVIQTAQGPVYIPQPPAPGAQNPFTGQPMENPWSQQDSKGLAAVLLLAGVKLTWNAATSMWDAVTAAYNQNFEDRVKLRDQTNQWITDCYQRGYCQLAQEQVVPQAAQRYPQTALQMAQQNPQAWPQWPPARNS